MQPIGAVVEGLMQKIIGNISSEKKLEYTEGICEECETKMQILKEDGKIVQKKCDCDKIAFSKQISQQVWEDRRKKEQQHALDMFDQGSLMNDELKECSFETFIAETKSQQKAFAAVKDIVQKVADRVPHNVLLSGSYGIGKSHIAAAACREIAKQGGSALFINVPMLLTKFKGSYRKDSEYSEEDYLARLGKVDLLVIDDLGANKDTEWTDEKLFQVIDSRQGKNTIYTTNDSSAALKQKIGLRNMNRLMNKTLPLKIEGKCRREMLSEEDWGF